MKPYGIDHLVLALDDLERGTETFRKLGFTVAPKARHPFGTANAVIQFANHAYLELLGIEDASRIPEGSELHFSFGAFNRGFLRDGEGLSMVARRSEDSAADLEAFEAGGLRTYNPAGFERDATGPDGTNRKISFSMAHTGQPGLPRIGFFTCHHHAPENFWFNDFQAHENGAAALRSAVIVAPDPVDHHEFLTHFTGQHEMRSTSLGVEFDLGDTKIEVMSPTAFSAFFGEDAATATNRIGAVRFTVDDLRATRDLLEARSLHYRMFSGSVVVPSGHAHGAVLAFSAKE